MSRPAVTVVVPTRDRRELLAETVRSVRAQTVPVEIVVVDDASGDDTAAWLADQPDLTVRRHDRPVGPPASRNAGAALGSADWLAFVDDDDLWAPDKLATQLDHLADHPAARWSATGCVWIDRQRGVIGARRMPPRHETPEEVAVLLGQQNHVPGGCSSVVVHRTLFAEAGGFAEDLEGCEDWELWLRLAATSPVAYVDRPLVGYRRWEANRSNDVARSLRAHAEVRRRHRLTDPRALRDERRIFAQRRARAAVVDGRRVAAAAAYARATAGGGPGQLAYAAASLVAPARVIARLRSIDRAEVPPGWQDDARRWLATV